MIDILRLDLRSVFALVEWSPIAAPGFCAGIEEDASVRFPIEVVDEHLFEVGVARSTVTNELPFGVDVDAFALWRGENEVGGGEVKFVSHDFERWNARVNGRLGRAKEP